jgi:molybdopterin/thiamine biosynthesis adenylyltransferase
MTDEQLTRYSRHLLLEAIGIEGQRRLLGTHALVIGAGGLGSAALLYLAGAGFGRITIVDHDRVDLTNLQRQVVHDMQSIGRPKADSAAARMRALNPELEVVPLCTRADAALLEQQVPQAHLVLDCSDNYATRHAVNRACVRHGRPLVSAAAIRFEAQIGVFTGGTAMQGDRPCYACLFPADAEVEETRCAVMGVLAPLVGMLGSMQAIEAIKLAAAAGESLAGRLLLVDALDLRVSELRVRRDPDCAVCGPRR